MKSAPSQPAAPDYVGAANAQGAANVDTARIQARMNNPNISTPYGNRFIKWEGDQPNISEDLNPVSQAIFDKQQQVRLGMAGLGNAALGTAQNVLGTGFDASSVPAVQTSIQNRQQASGDILNPGAQSSFGNSGIGAQSSFDTSDVARMPVNAGMTAQNAIMSRLEPQQNRQREQYINRLMSEGHVRGNEGFDNAMREFEQGATDQRTQAALQGIGVDMQANQQGYGQALQAGQFANQARAQEFSQGLASGQFANQARAQEFSQGLTAGQFANQAMAQDFSQRLAAGQYGNQAAAQNFNQALQAGQFGNTAQQQAMAQALYQRNLPLNEIAALMSGSQIQNPQFMGYQGGTIAPPPIANATGQQAQWNQGLYNSQVGQANAANSGLFGLGSAAISLSDRRLKSNIERIGTHPLGIGIYEYDIFGRHERGVMAQELLPVMPEAVILTPSGYLAVRYDLIGGRP